MSLDLLPADSPKPRRGLGFRLCIVAVVVVLMLTAAKAWESGYRPASAWQGQPESLATVEIERGDLAVYVQEFGTLESAANTTVRCQVEAMLGLVGGTTKGQGGTSAGGTEPTYSEFSGGSSCSSGV